MNDQTKRLRGGAVEVCPECDIAGCRHIRSRAALAAQPAADDAMERALTELVDKIVPGLDTGDLVADARTASKALDRAQPAASAEPGLWPVDECAAIRSRRDGYKDGTDEQFHYMNGYRRACSNDRRAALAAQPAASAEPGGEENEAWALAEAVRSELDRQSCPDAFMRIAVESIVKHARALLSRYGRPAGECFYVDAGHLREVRNGNDMPVSMSTTSHHGMMPLYTAAVPAGDAQPIRLEHMAVADEDGLRWMSGRKMPTGVESVELYAVPGYGKAPNVVYAAPVAAQKADDAELSLRQQYEDACIAANANALDAERYRWLRSDRARVANVIDREYAPGYWEYRCGEELDAAIDAAIAQQESRT